MIYGGGFMIRHHNSWRVFMRRFDVLGLYKYERDETLKSFVDKNYKRFGKHYKKFQHKTRGGKRS